MVPLPRVYVGTDLRSGLTRSETAAEMTRRYPKEDGPYTVDQIEAIELRALAKLRAVAEECKFIREWFDLRSAS